MEICIKYTQQQQTWAAPIFFLPCMPQQLFINYEQKKCGAQPQRAAGGGWWGVINYGRLTSSINQLPPSVVQSCFFYERDLYNSKERKVLRALLDIGGAAAAGAISNSRASELRWERKSVTT
jgi:hypothetical protein